MQTHSLNWSLGRRGDGANHTHFIKSLCFGVTYSQTVRERERERPTQTHTQPAVPVHSSLPTEEIRLIVGLWGRCGANCRQPRLAVCNLMGYGSIRYTMDLWELQSHGHKSPLQLAPGL